MASCVFVPSKGAKLFKTLRKNFGYGVARKVFLTGIHPQFINKYKKGLDLDKEGVPSYESLMRNKYIKNMLGETLIHKSLQDKFKPVEDTRKNYEFLLEDAYKFNTENEQRDDYVAVVNYVDKDKIRVVILPKTTKNTDQFNQQYSAQKLNERLLEIFEPIGLTIGDLSRMEEQAGRIGVTDFTRAKDVARGFGTLIRLANNREGAEALPEEFAHVIVGIFRDSPLVSRALDVLQGNTEVLQRILGDDYQDVYDYHNGDMDAVAEEALGHILRDNLVRNVTPTPNPSLFRRMINWIIQQFKNFSLDNLEKTINNVDSSMSKLAKDILNGTIQVTEDDIENSQRDLKLNALSDRINRNLDILKQAEIIERKRLRISKDKAKINNIKDTIEGISEFRKDGKDTVEGVLRYAKKASDELKSKLAGFRMIDAMSQEQKFAFLRSARSYMQSYDSFIQAMKNALDEEELEDDNMFAKQYVINGLTLEIPEILKELSELSSKIGRLYTRYAMPAFAEFLSPFLGENIKVPFGKYAGTTISVEELLKEAKKDISIMDMWLDSMADSSDVLLQLIDAAVKDAKDTARLETMDIFRDIWSLRDEFEAAGITDTEWIFEKDSNGRKSGNYISRVNYAQFELEKQEMFKRLEEKYGKNPRGQDAINYIEERDLWLEKHAASKYRPNEPNPVYYRNEDYENLSDSRKLLLEHFLNLKQLLDKKLPDSRVDRLKAIQIRKRGNERLWESITSPESLFEHIKNSIAETFLDREDDDQIFGEKYAEGLQDFSGQEFMTLPVLYTNRLKNPNELSTDVFGSLMAYAYMACNYEQMDKIIDPLEVGRTLIKENRKVKQTRGGRALAEKYKQGNNVIVNTIYKDNSNIEARLDAYYESQVYGRYLADSGTLSIFGVDTKINKNKFTSWILKSSSVAQLGLNWLANLGNVTTGVCMQNIEAAAGQHFGFKELARADGIYASEIPKFLSELSSRNKTSKLALVYELLDIRQDFNKTAKNSIQTKNWLKRLFGAEVAFLGQEAGDHWMYGRTAIAMMLRQEVLLNGQRMNLWEALQTKSVKGNDNVKELNYKDITDLDGNPFNFKKFGRRIADVNHDLFGIYNDDDSNAANRVALGRLAQQYRKWMKVQYNRRFQANQYSVTLDDWKEGYYVTLGRVSMQLLRGMFQMEAKGHKLEDFEKQNIRRALWEIFQFVAVCLVCRFVEWPDDKDRPWFTKLAEYACRRLKHELGGLTPSTIMPQELLKTVKTPFPSLGVVQNGFNLVNSLLTPEDYFNTIQSGPYKGMNNVEKNFIKAPLPILPQVRQIQRFTGDLDTSIMYYVRPSLY